MTLALDEAAGSDLSHSQSECLGDRLHAWSLCQSILRPLQTHMYVMIATSHNVVNHSSNESSGVLQQRTRQRRNGRGIQGTCGGRVSGHTSACAVASALLKEPPQALAAAVAEASATAFLMTASV